MNKQVIKILANIVALYLGSVLLTDVTAVTHTTIMIGGVVLWLVNLVIRPILMLITIPVNLLTLGLFSLVINTWMVILVDKLVGGFDVNGFITAFLLAVLVSIVNIVLMRSLKSKK